MKYTFFWLDGKKEVLEGTTPADALTKAGYGNGAIKALDFFIEGKNNKYIWGDHKYLWKDHKEITKIHELIKDD